MKNSFKKIFSWFFFILLSLYFTNLYAQSQTKAIPQRSDIADKYKWSLEDVFPITDVWEKDFSELEQHIPQISTFKGHLSESAKKLLDCLVLNDSLNNKLDQLNTYANLKSYEDTRVSSSQQILDRISALYTKLNEANS